MSTKYINSKKEATELNTLCADVGNNVRSPRAFVTGVSGQVASYLVEYLLEKGYEVVGLNRRKSVDNLSNLAYIKSDKFSLVEGDLTDAVFINNYFCKNKFDELYNLAAQSHVHTSFEQPQLTFEVNTIGTLNLLEAIRNHMPECRAYFASTSEMYGSSKPPQNLDTTFHPRSPYGCAKLAAHWLVDVYRDSYKLDVACGVMFNTESPRRGDNFVTKKIVNYINKYREACLSNTWEKVPSLELGNLDAKRDWSHVKDSVEAIYRICNQRDYFTITWGHEIDLNIKFDKFSHEGIDRKVITAGTQEKPATAKEIADLQEQLSRPMKYKDYTFGSGKAYSVREFLKSALEFAFHSKNRFEFVDSGLQERVVDLHTGREIVVISPKFFRPAEVDYLLADSTVIKQELGWEPKISFDDLVADMFLGK